VTYNLDKDSDSPINLIKVETKKEIPLKEKNILPRNKQYNLDYDKDEKVILKPDEKISWLLQLPKGKIFIRITTLFNKQDAEKKYLLFKKIFNYTIGIQQEKKYILYIGPIAIKDIDASMLKINNYGFKDAYIEEEK
jgi:hypothetical protein